jgi:glycosyltransferase involved in cell wall biosynthesis
MIIFLIRSKITSGHEKMFKLIYDNLTIEKKYCNLINKTPLALFFRNKKFVISSGYPLQNLLLIFILKILFKKVYVYTPFGFKIKLFNVKLSLLKEILVKIVYAGKNVSVITCSYEQKKLFEQRFPNKMIYHLNNYTDHNKIRKLEVSNQNNIFYIGRIDQKQKNCKIFLELANQTNYFYNLIGKLDDKNLKAYLKHDRIFIYGSMSNPFEKVTNNSCLILPSFYEGAALIVIEACYHNIPIFLSNCVGNRYFADEVITFNNTNDLIILLNKHFNKDEDLNKKWLNFRMNVLKNYNKEVFISQLSNLEMILE